MREKKDEGRSVIFPFVWQERFGEGDERCRDLDSLKFTILNPSISRKI